MARITRTHYGSTPSCGLSANSKQHVCANPRGLRWVLTRVAGDSLVDATSTGVYRVTPAPLPPSMWMGEPWDWQGMQPQSSLRGCAVANVSEVAVAQPNPGYSTGVAGEGLLIGQFRLADGRTAVLLHNHNTAWTLWPTVAFAER